MCWMNLQLFAEEGGESPDQQRLMELGVPEDKARRFAQRQEKLPEGAVQSEEAAAQQEVQTEPEAMPEAEPFRAHILGLEQQAAALQRQFPGFDLRQELRNPAFLRLTSPTVGLSVEDAYHVVHRREIREAETMDTARKIANAIRSGQLRPRENGIGGQAAAVTTFDYRRATPEQRAALKAHIRSEAAQGRKVYPGRVQNA